VQRSSWREPKAAQYAIPALLRNGHGGSISIHASNDLARFLLESLQHPYIGRARAWSVISPARRDADIRELNRSILDSKFQLDVTRREPFPVRVLPLATLVVTWTSPDAHRHKGLFRTETCQMKPGSSTLAQPSVTGVVYAIKSDELRPLVADGKARDTLVQRVHEADVSFTMTR
jgi:hypothetical protein